MLQAAPAPAATAAAPIATAAEAAALAVHFSQVMEALLGIVEEETKLVRAGRIRDAARLESSKSDLARLYLTDSTRLRACRAVLQQHAPQLLTDLRQRHELFRALLQINLTVLATAHAVAEGLVRGVSGELARRSAPQTYTAYGRNCAKPTAVPPMAVSRRL